MVIERVARFWRKAIEQLANTEHSSSLTVVEEKSGREFLTYRVVITSLDRVRIRAWYSMPNDLPKSGKLPAVLTFPGYDEVKPIPTHLVVNGYAVLQLYPRSQGESRAEWELEFGTKLTYHVTDPNRYYYRGAYVDCIRGLDFLCSRQEIDPSRIGIWARSQGGAFALTTASLDQRPAAVVAEQPFLSNYPVAIDMDLPESPYSELREYLENHPDDREAVLSTLQYFDTLNLVDGIRCPTLVNIGKQDVECPFETIMPVFDRIRSQKAIIIYPDLPHSPSTDFNVQAVNWLKRYIG